MKTWWSKLYDILKKEVLFVCWWSYSMQHAMPMDEALGTDEDFPLGGQSLPALPAKMNLECHYGHIRRYQGPRHTSKLSSLLVIRYQSDHLRDRAPQHDPAPIPPSRGLSNCTSTGGHPFDQEVSCPTRMQEYHSFTCIVFSHGAKTFKPPPSTTSARYRSRIPISLICRLARPKP